MGGLEARSWTGFVALGHHGRHVEGGSQSLTLAELCSLEHLPVEAILNLRSVLVKVSLGLGAEALRGLTELGRESLG